MSHVPNLKVQVWREEIDISSIEVGQAQMSIENIYQRLRHQEAPPALIERVFEMKAELESCLASLHELGQCFPSKPY